MGYPVGEFQLLYVYRKGSKNAVFQTHSAVTIVMSSVDDDLRRRPITHETASREKVGRHPATALSFKHYFDTLHL